MMTAPRDDDFITNSDASKVVPDENPEPLEGTKTHDPGTKPQQTGTKAEESNAADDKKE